MSKFSTFWVDCLLSKTCPYASGGASIKLLVYCFIHWAHAYAIYGMGGCARPGIQSEDQNQFFTFKVRTFWQSEVKISVLTIPWYGCRGYGNYPLFVHARHVQRCVKKCPHFECVIHRFVLALNAGTNTLYTRVYIVSSLWMPGQVGVNFCM